jgi:hypothetical protein
MNKVLYPTFELVSSPTILLSDVKEGLKNDGLSKVRIFEPNGKVTTDGECISNLSKLIGKENTENNDSYY